MNPAISQEINLLKGFLDQSTDLGIVIGDHQNLDTAAAALAMYLSLSQAGKKAQIISKKEPTVEISNLVAVNKITSGFVGNTNKLVVSLPYIKGEIEKVLFTEFPNSDNPTKINFHLTAAPDKTITPFNISDVKLIWEGGAPSAIITIGVSSVDELSGIIDLNSTKVVNIDNYQANSRFGDLVIVDESFSSLAEIVGKIIKDLSLPMDVDVAQNILDGVLHATRNFTKQNTSPLAFEAVSSAMYKGAQRKGEEVPVQQQPRRDQGFSENRQNNAPRQDRQNRDQDRGGRDARQQPQQQNNNRSSQRSVNPSDFPAMHMQPQQRNAQQARQNNPVRNMQQSRPGQQFPSDRPVAPQQSRPQSTFPQSNPDVDLLREKIRSEQAKYEPTEAKYQEEQQVQEAQIVTEPIDNNNTASIDDVMPQEERFNAPTNDEIPDDWLMPKVFKSSKNNN